MKLIDRYVTEVGRRLALLKGRRDIENELRSTLEDMLEDRARKAGRAADESLEMDLLREYGSPQQVAATYNPMPYVIGPRMFPVYLMVLRIVLTVLTIVLIVTTGIQIATQSPATGLELLTTIGSSLAGIFSAAISAFGMVTLIFAILERYVPAEELKMESEKEWDPAILMKEPEPDDVKIWEPVLAIVFTVIVLAIFNFNRDLIGFHFFTDGKWTSLPALTDAFYRWMPWINITWIAEIVLNGILLRTTRWDSATRWFSIAIKLVQIVIGYFLITGPSIVAFSPQTLQATGIFNSDTARILGTMAQQGARSIIALIIFLEGVDLVKTGFKLVTRRSAAAA